MQTITRVVLAVGLLACVTISAAQAMAKKPGGGGSCAVVNGACVSTGCVGECGPLPPASCACIHQ
jgi:hypothetical protein